jgi:acetyltransferase-like isoleucine patch superfamily enzyme
MHKSLPRQIMNRILHIIAQFSPGAHSLRPFLHKLRGVKIYGTVFIGDQVYLENEYPEMVEIHDEAVITLRTTILAHNYGKGKIIISKKAYIGTGAIITATPGQTLIIGEGSVIAANSVVTKDIEPYTLVGGSPAKPIARITVPLIFSSGTSTISSYLAFKNGLVPISKK